ncbi:Aste57867_16936 [Aphanomyces stellatus]|uniref:Aste57867_16936 protein n=1 Tax=Aphanomyces stellatus TaxID=120398 RepID=A0A485L6L6_9STRA|nr:hypothetical protein As57867_016878 [Aphanomyces stellatus]VFT93698.1 Aste57867_16936 [Aphanomyces stellatus]
MSKRGSAAHEGRRDSAMKRFSMILRSHNAHMKVRHSLAAPWVRTPVLLLIVFMNVVSAIYLGIWGVFFLTAHPIILATLNLYAPVPSGVIYIGLAGWHAYDVGIVLFGTHKFHQLRDHQRLLASFHLKWVERVKSQPARRVLSWIAKNEILRLGRHALVVVVLSIHAHHVCCATHWDFSRSQETTSVECTRRVHASSARLYEIYYTSMKHLVCYNVSHHVVRDWFAFTYTMLVAFYCFVTPSCLLSSHPFIKRYVTLLNDAFFHFLLSTGLSSFVFFPQVVQFSTAETLPWVQDYLHQLVLDDRALVSTSLSDLVLFLFIFVTNHLTLHHLTHVALSASSIQQIQTMIQNDKDLPPLAAADEPPRRDDNLMPLPSAESSGSLKRKQHGRPRLSKPMPDTVVEDAADRETDVATFTPTQPPPPTAPPSQATVVPSTPPIIHSTRLSLFPATFNVSIRRLGSRRLTARAFLGFKEQSKTHFKLFFAVNVVWGLVLVVAACTGLWHAPCPRGCLAHTSPWFDARSCTCKHFQLHCPKLGVTTDAQSEAILDMLDVNLFSLHVVDCGFVHGLTRLDRFPALFSLRMEYSALETWDHGSLPNTLQVLDLRYCNLTTIPAILDVPDLPLVSLAIEGSNLAHVPDSLASWPNLMAVRITHGHLTAIPPVFAKSQVLSLLTLSFNAITAVDVDDVAPALRYLDLSNNDITTLSDALVAEYLANPLVVVLVSNPLAAIHPSLVARIILVPGMFDIADTPVCATLASLLPQASAKSICYTKCAPLCPLYSIGDHISDADCNVPACDLDGGDFNQYNWT